MVESYLDSKNNIAMTQEETGVFLQCCQIDMSNESVLTSEQAKQMGFASQVFFGRLEFSHTPVSMAVGAFLSYLSKGSPGNAVMWAYAMNRLYKEKRQTINMSLLADAFPWGFPSEDEQIRLWRAQKGEMHNSECDNMVDQAETWNLEEKQND